MKNTASDTNSSHDAISTWRANYLAEVAQLDAARAYKRLTYDLLSLSPGQRVLDVGCGIGEDALALADLVGDQGLVCGVDHSEAMVEAAQRSVVRQGAAVEFRCADAHELPFADGSFHACRVDRVLQHVTDPEQVLDEMLRVCAPGGRIVVSEPDWSTLVVADSDQSAISVLREGCRRRANHPSMGSRALPLLVARGVVATAVLPATAIMVTVAEAEFVFQLKDGLQRAVKDGLLNEAAAVQLTERLAAATCKQAFFAALTGFVVAGTKPTEHDLGP